MAVTRSSGKQTLVEDFPTMKTKAQSMISKEKPKASISSPKKKATTSPRANVAVKRKATSKPASRSLPISKTPKIEPATPMATKQQDGSSDDPSYLSSPVVINRAPVLQLWGACVAEFLYPELSWHACLSIGSAISSLCAVSKGRAIGMIEPKDPDADDGEKQEKAKKAKKGAEVYAVMGFPLSLKGDEVVLGGKTKGVKEENLFGKFGGEDQYEAVRKKMVDELRSWKGDEEELAKRAFRMYEEFRPSVAQGQQGWGRKGNLSLEEIENVVRRS